MQIAPRDFLCTTDGYLCAVLAWPLADGSVEAWPRYVRHPEHGRWVKIDSLPGAPAPSVRLLRDADITRVLHSRARVREIEQMRPSKRDAMEERALRFIALLTVLGVPHDAIGITGSTLLGMQGDDSDLDITIHGRSAFHRGRAAIERLVTADLATAIDDDGWREVYARRAPAIDFATFVRHERRKHTRVMFDGARVDLTMVSSRNTAPAPGPRRILGRAVLDAIVTDATAAYDYPAQLVLDHHRVHDVEIYTNTYVGQAESGERIRVAGVLEQDAEGRLVMVVGTSRAAPGEYVVVLAAAVARRITIWHDINDCQPYRAPEPGGHRMTDDIVHRIITANAGRDPERLARKFTAMRSSPFTFLRGTAHLYFDAWPMNGALDSAPLAWCCGDLHLENFGTYRGDNRLTYFDLNDFDEAALAPTTCDVTRLLTSLDVAAESLKIAPEVKGELETRFLDAYYATLADGRPRWVERATAKGMIRDLIRGLKRRKRRELLEHRTNRRGGGRRRLVVDGTYALPCSDEQRALVERLLKQYTATYHMPDFFEPIDVARRVAGTGSLGIERYVVLVEGRGSPNGNFLLDIKRAQPSVLASRLPIPATPWQTVAERVVDVERRAQAASPALFSAVGDANASYVLRELQPREDRLHLEHANGNRKQLGIVMTAMGVLTASAHMRTGGWRGAAIADEWIAFGSAQTLRDDIVAHAAEAANVTRADWAAFAKAYDDGAFAAK